MSERDSVIDMYCVHQYPKNYLIKEILLVPDYDNPKIISWLNHDPGYPILDSILTKYGFISYDKDPKYSFIVLRTELDINIYYVLKLLNLVDGIIYADPNLSFGSGPNFNYRSSGTDRFLTFSIGWGDCMAGCIWRHIWQFKINKYNQVEYAGTIKRWNEDHPIPEPQNCNITGLRDNNDLEQLIVFPNPSADYIRFNKPFQNKTQYRILNMNGQLVKKGYLIGDDETISISELKKGIYLIQLDDAENVWIYKFSRI